MQKIFQLIKIHFFYRQHPETALRYIPIIELLNKEGWADSQILEIGSGSYGITPYLHRQIVGVDLNFSEPQYSLLTQVSGSADHLPFPANHFDICLLSDVLEHLPSSTRRRCLQEAVRVARLGVIINGPFGPAAFAQDKALAQHSRHPYLLEHLKFGLPDRTDVTSFTHSKLLRVETVGESLNLSVRWNLMRLFISPHRLVYYFYLKGMMFFVPILQHLNSPPCYRTLFLLRLKPLPI